MDGCGGFSSPVEGYVVAMEEGANWETGDDFVVGEEEEGTISASLEAHTYTEFGEWDFVDGCAG